jgi:hypothetical protein
MYNSGTTKSEQLFAVNFSPIEQTLGMAELPGVAKYNLVEMVIDHCAYGDENHIHEFS